ncbi:MAG: DUF378 domain-containing protein [Thermoleophilia bacterium]|nr:DUF378 domain-containing protein [Thermoleophilia bacterium]
MRLLDPATLLLIVVGGINWGLVGLAEFDLVAWICGGLDFGETNVASRIIYLLVGVAALYWLVRLPTIVSSRSDRYREESLA